MTATAEEILETARQTTGAGVSTSAQTRIARATGTAETEETAGLPHPLLGTLARASGRRLSLARRSPKQYRTRGSPLPLPLLRARTRAVRTKRMTMKQQWPLCSALAGSAPQRWVASNSFLSVEQV